MGTRAYIIVKTESGKFRGIYNQMDGGPEHLGQLLLCNFKDTEQVESLISVGDIQSLQDKETFKRLAANGYASENEWIELDGLMVHIWENKTYPSIEADDISEFQGIAIRYLYLWDTDSKKWYCKENEEGFQLLGPVVKSYRLHEYVCSGKATSKEQDLIEVD